MSRKFWMLWRGDGRLTPKADRFLSLEDAEDEARRIAGWSLMPVYILESVAMAHKEQPPVSVTAIGEDS